MHLEPVRPSTLRHRLGAPVAAGFALLVAVGGTVALVATVGEAPEAAARQADTIARSETRAAGEHGSGPGTSSATARPEAALDPRLSDCAEANARGLGPHVSGVDPEYGWYSDTDADGVACEA